jgi:hypothetical protein
MREGAGITEHEPVFDEIVAAARQRPEVAEAIDRHIAEHFGPVSSVLHEFVSHLVTLHVHVVAPTPERPFHTLITSGMSDLPMTVPDGVSPFAELMICLPADWPLTDEAVREPRTGWPIDTLKAAARLPHQYSTWIGEWHSVPNGDPPMPFALNTPFAGVVVTPMITVGERARVIRVPDGTDINLLAVVPLHPDELAVKVQQGTDALVEILDRGGISEVFDPTRPSYATARP